MAQVTRFLQHNSHEGAPFKDAQRAGGPVNALSPQDFQFGCPIQGREATLSGVFREASLISRNGRVGLLIFTYS